MVAAHLSLALAAPPPQKMTAAKVIKRVSWETHALLVAVKLTSLTT